jgi:ribokinase
MVIDVVGYGALNYDYIFVVDDLATGDQQVVIREFHGTPGGSAANTINGLSRLDVKTGFVGAVGIDIEGRTILEQMLMVKTDVSRIKTITSMDTSKIFVYVDSNAERAMYSLPGASNHFEPTAEDIECMKTGKYTIISSLPGKDQLQKIQMVVEQIYEDTQVIFMPGGMYSKFGYSELKEAISRSYFLILNRREVEELTGCDFSAGAKWLTEHGAKTVVVTLGKDGCLICEQNSSTIIPTPKLPPEKITDSTGAGDAFAAGFIFGMLQGKPMTDSALCGNLAARSCIQVLGARAGILNKKELLKDFNKFSKEIVYDK